MIGIIDYGLGNIQAFINVFKKLNKPCLIINHKEAFSKCDRFILPGVGAFDHAMSKFSNSGLREVLTKIVLEDKNPVLGICVGMQMLANESQEGILPGLGWINGKVKKFEFSDKNILLPHMGWNNIEPINVPIFNGISKDSKFYFLHSYYFECENDMNCICKSNYGIEFVSAINKDNIFGIQFHPEKSHENGLKLLNNFTNL